MALPNGREWNVVLELDGKGRVAGKVSVGGRLLLPTLDKTEPSEALAYIEGALVDMRDEDSAEGRVLSPVGGAQTYKAHSNAMLVLWLRDVLDRTQRQVDAFSETPTGIRNTRLGTLGRAPESLVAMAARANSAEGPGKR